MHDHHFMPPPPPNAGIRQGISSTIPGKIVELRISSNTTVITNITSVVIADAVTEQCCTPITLHVTTMQYPDHALQPNDHN
jgi:hypothetical protein